jgi:hypothetical protein
MSGADRNPLASSVIAVALVLAGAVAMAADAPAKKNQRPAKPAAAPREVKLPEATPDQEKAAELVYYGVYECEFNQNVNILASTTHHFYFDVKHGKRTWLMKPVLSTTGAVLLEDVKGQTLMVQIASKSMLLNVKTRHRIVDACISPRQREVLEAAKTSKPADDTEDGAPLPTGGTSPPDAGTASTPMAPSGASSTSK